MPRTIERLDTLWTPTDVAIRYGLAEKTLRNWRALGIGPAHIKVGTRVLYREAELARWEQTRERAS
jgi:hypothetical protein